MTNSMLPRTEINARTHILHNNTWFYLSNAAVNAFPKTCLEVHKYGGHDGYYNLDPEQDGLDPVSVYCNMSNTPITAIVHHDREEWTFVNGYERPGSYNGKVGSATDMIDLLSTLKLTRWNENLCHYLTKLISNDWKMDQMKRGVGKILTENAHILIPGYDMRKAKGYF